MNVIDPNSIDQTGVYGSILHYSLIIFFMGGALLIFLYLWRKGRLDMDEEPKIQMMKDDEENDKDDKSK
jgi:hypothetical protein